MFGFDFSHWNSDKQFFQYVEKADFFFHKSSEGGHNQDPCCISRLKATTKPCGVYHVVCPKKNSWEEEFDNFCIMIDKIKSFRKIGIALDLENAREYVPYDSTQEIEIWLFNLVKALVRRYGQPVILYMGDLYPDIWYKDLADAGAIFWIARWGKQPKHFCHFHQTGSKFNGENLDTDQAMVSDKEVLRVLGDTGSTEKRVTEEELQAALRVLSLSVWDGRFGSGEERKEMIYKEVQNYVNQL